MGGIIALVLGLVGGTTRYCRALVAPSFFTSACTFSFSSSSFLSRFSCRIASCRSVSSSLAAASRACIRPLQRTDQLQFQRESPSLSLDFDMAPCHHGSLEERQDTFNTSPSLPLPSQPSGTVSASRKTPLALGKIGMERRFLIRGESSS